MKLISFSTQYLRLKEALPFGVRDSSGCLLLAAGQVIDSNEQLAHLRAQKLFADDAESSEWRRRLAAAMDSMLRQNAALKEIAAARPSTADGKDARERADASLPEQWEDLCAALEAALRDARPGSDWLARVDELHQRARRLAARRSDASMYYLIYTAGHTSHGYASHHALLTLLVCEQAARLLEWDDGRITTLGRAALTMNVAMLRLQDLLAHSDLAPSAEMRAEIDAHAERGAVLLKASGADDDCCETVRLHHDASRETEALPSLTPPQQMARLLRRVDIFTAKLSRRKTRAPMSPVRAAKEACLGADGQPDAIGAALLKTMGLYPPGSFVELASGEVGVVVARGRRANLPLVASLVAPSGAPMGEPTLRDTIETRFAVKGAVAAAQVRVRPVHQRVLALI